MLSNDELAVLNCLLYNESNEKTGHVGFLEGYSNYCSEHGSVTIYDYYRGEGKERGIDIFKYPPRPDGAELGIEWIPKEDWDAAVNSILDNPDSALRDLTLLEVDSLNERGSVAACFVDPEGQPYAVFKGTGTDADASEWTTNSQGLYMADTEPQIEARGFVDYCHYLTGKDVVVTGHSNGGNKSMYSAVTSDHVERCVAFDGQGFSSEFLAAYEERLDELQGKYDSKNAPTITNISTEGDFVNQLMFSIAHIALHVQATRLGDEMFKSYGMNHSPISVLGKDAKLGEDGMPSQAAREINAFTVWLVEHSTWQDRKSMGDFLGEVSNALMGTKQDGLVAVLRDNPEGLGVLMTYVCEYPDSKEFIKTMLAEILATPSFSDQSSLQDRENT